MLNPRLDWREKLEALKQELLLAANPDDDAVSVELPPGNETVVVLVGRDVTCEQRKAMTERTRRRFRELCPGAKPNWGVTTKPVHSYPYTSHLKKIASTQTPADEIASITLIDVTKAGLTALRDCYDSLGHGCSAYDFVATFALGGIPALQFITTSERLKLERTPPAEMTSKLQSVQQQYHLLPGLHWRKDAQDYFLNWITSLPSKSRVFLFDTGHSGNGPRQMFGLLKKHVGELDSFGPAEILIRGIVDNVNDDQVEGSETFESGGGDQVQVSIDYVHVPQILTEDLPKLIGFDSHRHELSAETVAEAGVLRILDKDGKEIETVGAVRAADLMAAADKMPDAAPQADDLGRATAFMLMPLLKDKELEALRCALSLGWVSNDKFEAQELGLEEKYKAFAQKEICYKWNPQALKSEKLKPGE